MNKETCECQHLRKMSFWEIFNIQCIYIAKLGCRPSMKSLWTFIMIRDDMTLCWCTYSSSQISILFTALGIHYFSYSGQRKKNKLTWAISQINKAFMNFHHDASNTLFHLRERYCSNIVCTPSLSPGRWGGGVHEKPIFRGDCLKKGGGLDSLQV